MKNIPTRTMHAKPNSELASTSWKRETIQASYNFVDWTEMSECNYL